MSWGLTRNEVDQLILLLAVEEWTAPSKAEADTLHFLEMFTRYEFYFGNDGRQDKTKESGVLVRFLSSRDFTIL
ncbi:MAG: hypothetical protein ACYCPP_03630 [Nitrososphaerales archaeon]